MEKAIYSRLDLNDITNPKIREFNEILSDLLTMNEVQQLDEFSQHLNTTRLQHSLNVAYYTFLICRKFNWHSKEATRAALLHDLFHYDWREKTHEGWHPALHPRVALENARKIADVTPLMADCIVKHMWPMTLKAPRYKEGWVITGMDKYCATLECIHQSSSIVRKSAAVMYLASFISFIHLG